MTVYSGLKLRRIHLHGFNLSRVYGVAKKRILSRIIQIKLNQVKKKMCNDVSQYLPSTCGREEERPWERGWIESLARHRSRATWVEPLYSWGFHSRGDTATLVNKTMANCA